MSPSNSLQMSVGSIANFGESRILRALSFSSNELCILMVLPISINYVRLRQSIVFPFHFLISNMKLSSTKHEEYIVDHKRKNQQIKRTISNCVIFQYQNTKPCLHFFPLSIDLTKKLQTEQSRFSAILSSQKSTYSCFPI